MCTHMTFLGVGFWNRSMTHNVVRCETGIVFLVLAKKYYFWGLYESTSRLYNSDCNGKQQNLLKRFLVPCRNLSILVE
jgi:hypothetical protein